MLGGEDQAQDPVDVFHLRGAIMHTSALGRGGERDLTSRPLAYLHGPDRRTPYVSRNAKEWQGLEEEGQGWRGG